MCGGAIAAVAMRLGGGVDGRRGCLEQVPSGSQSLYLPTVWKSGYPHLGFSLVLLVAVMISLLRSATDRRDIFTGIVAWNTKVGTATMKEN